MLELAWRTWKRMGMGREGHSRQKEELEQKIQRSRNV